MRDYRKAKWKMATEQQRQVAEGLKSGKTVRKAMLDAGYAASTADKGLAGVSKVALSLIGKESPLIEIGKAMSWQDHAHLVLGRLAVNAASGKDGGSLSAKILGSHKALQMWQAENQINQVIITAPGEVPEEK